MAGGPAINSALPTDGKSAAIPNVSVGEGLKPLLYEIISRYTD